MGDWILVKSNPDESVTQGGIIIPGESRRTAVKTGVVKAIGPGRINKKGVRIPPDVEVGDTVSYIFALEKTRTGKTVKMALGDDEFLLRESDVLTVEQ
jgi:chaperonin GroES